MPEIRVVVSGELDRYMDTVVKKGMFGSKAELIRAAVIRYFETLPIRIPSGYDDTTLFSPDGRIFQIEYALECAARGAVMVGLRYHDGLILAKQRFSFSDPKDKIENILSSPAWNFAVDSHVGAVPVGVASDFILIKDKAMREAQSYQRETGESIGVEELVKRLSIFMQSYTTKKDMRPLGCVVLIGGVDQTGRRLFVLDPSGSYNEISYQVTGYKSAETQQVIKDNFNPNMSQQEALALVIRAILKEETRKPEEISVAVVEEETKALRRITTEEIKEAWKTAFKKKKE